MKIQVEVVVTPCSVVVGYWCFGGLCLFFIRNMNLRNVGILQQNYTTLQPRRRRLEQTEDVWMRSAEVDTWT
jgi:hypothetical protein